jgi:choline dehydrogenase-like flavoprotein
MDFPALCSLEEFLKYDYDFIIVGGGTAGLTVAARLSENSSYQVGVLEAGAKNLFDPMIMVPALCFQIPGNPQYDWAHKTVPQVSAITSYKPWAFFDWSFRFTPAGWL